MEQFSLDPNHCVVNLSNSILAHFGVTPFHPTLPELDHVLVTKNYQNIILVLYDGMGFNILNRNLPKSSTLRANTVSELSAAFPPGTSASARSLFTGKFPIETGWIGFNEYIAPIDKTITLFRNLITDTGEPAAPYNVAEKYLPVTAITSLVSQQSGVTGIILSPYESDRNSGSHFERYHPTDLSEFTDKLKNLCQAEDRKLIYAYVDIFDTTAHSHGPDSVEAQKVLTDLNRVATELAQALKDTLLIITADHGHVLTDYYLLSDYPDITNMLQREPSLGKRTTTYFIKPEHLNDFPVAFKKHFGEANFVLLTKKQALNSQLFGPGTPHTLIDSIVGDFISVATANKAIANNDRANRRMSNHSGVTPDEISVPLIAIPLNP
jgi:hypothetical protein